MTTTDCGCGHNENHCRWCNAHEVTVSLRTQHEDECVARPARLAS